MLKKIAYLSLISFALSIGCSDDSTSSQTSQTVWEQKSQMLTNWADNFIVPNYQNLSNKLTVLETSVTSFNAAPNLESLETVRTSWLEAYKSWQHVEMFNIGPAEQSFYHLKMNVYPTSTQNIESLIVSGDFSNLDNAPYYSAQGFPAMDYLLFGLTSDDASIVDLYNSNPNYSNYLSEIMDRMVFNNNFVLNEWTSYRADFIVSVENTATSSANKMTNDFIYYYEKGFRANKFGIPVGIFSGGNIFPEKVEAYHNQNVSKLLALEAIDAIKKFFNGNGNPSLKHFLDNFATQDMFNLSSDINAQLDLGESSIENLDSNFVNQLNNEFLEMALTYDIIQAGTVLLKTDMLSVLQIATDYVDADGD
jgi:predicted lipoprotein